MSNNFSPPRFIIASILLVWLSCCSLIMNQSSASTLNCSSIERNALIDFKQNLSDPSARLSSWEGHNCCEWHGITCNPISGKVTKIDLRNKKGVAFFEPLVRRPNPVIIWDEFVSSSLGGTIPTSDHLQTLEDPSIYEGNPFLHISPRNKMPSGENTNSLHVPVSEVEIEEQDSEMFSFFISMAIGFPIGLNILFIAVFTSKSRRISYFCFVDRVSHNILEKVGILAYFFRRKRS